jgi:hypothetical protein
MEDMNVMPGEQAVNEWLAKHEPGPPERNDEVDRLITDVLAEQTSLLQKKLKRERAVQDDIRIWDGKIPDGFVDIITVTTACQYGHLHKLLACIWCRERLPDSAAGFQAMVEHQTTVHAANLVTCPWPEEDRTEATKSGTGQIQAPD